MDNSNWLLRLSISVSAHRHHFEAPVGLLGDGQGAAGNSSAPVSHGHLEGRETDETAEKTARTAG